MPPARLAALALIAALAPLGAQADEIHLALVPPAAGIAFFDAARDGCVAEAKARSTEATTISCIAPGPAAGTAAAGDDAQQSQAELIADLAAKHFDGLAVAPDGSPEVVAAINAAAKAGIPVVTFDADAPGSARRAWIGTNAKDFGRALGASLKRWKPNGGRYAILTGDPAAPNMAERVTGVRDALAAGWTEIPGSPYISGGDLQTAVKLMRDALAARTDIDAIVSVGAWPMLATDEWREFVAHNKTRVDQAQVVLVVADALPQQVQLVREGQGHVLVGQRPADMGARAVDLLVDLKRGRKAPEIVYVGFDTITRLDLVKAGN